jgi:hypothetical protein
LISFHLKKGFKYRKSEELLPQFTPICTYSLLLNKLVILTPASKELATATLLTISNKRPSK